MSTDLADWLAAAFLTTLCFATARAYGLNRTDAATADERDPTRIAPRHTRAYVYIRNSTLIAGLGALLFPNPVFFVVFHEPWSLFFGGVMAVVGFAWFGTTRVRLSESIESGVGDFLPTRLHANDPYASFRLPIRASSLMMLSGLTLMTGSLWILANTVMVAVHYHRLDIASERRAGADRPTQATDQARS